MLKYVIEKKRFEMYECADRFGFASKRTISVSQQLDRLLNLLIN